MDISFLGVFQVFIGILCGHILLFFVPKGAFINEWQVVFHWFLFMFVGGSIGFLLI